MNTKPLSHYLALFAAGLLAFSARGQYGGGGTYGGSNSGSYSTTLNFPSGPPSTMHPPGGYLGFQVPIERAGHSFQLKWIAPGVSQATANSLSVMGFISVAQPVMQSLLVYAPPPTYPQGICI